MSTPAYRKANREKIAAAERAYRDAHREEMAAYQRAYYADHREKIAAATRIRRSAHPEKIAAYKRAYRETNRAEIAARKAAYYKAHRERYAERCALRLARKAGATRVEKIDRAYVYERDGGKCHICGKKAPRRGFHLDHLIPLSKGGDHTHDNLAVAHARCNSQRGAGRSPAQLRLVG